MPLTCVDEGRHGGAATSCVVSALETSGAAATVYKKTEKGEERNGPRVWETAAVSGFDLAKSTPGRRMVMNG